MSRAIDRAQKALANDVLHDLFQCIPTSENLLSALESQKVVLVRAN